MWHSGARWWGIGRERENLANRMSMICRMLCSLIWWPLPRSQITGEAWCGWLSHGRWRKAGSACGWMGRQTSRLDSSVVFRPWKRRSDALCVAYKNSSNRSPEYKGAYGPQLTPGLYSHRAWHKVMHLKWYPARVFVSLERDMAEFQGETVDTRRPLRVTSSRGLCELPLGPAIKLMLGMRTSALCFSVHGGSYHWLSGNWGILILLVSQVIVPCSEHHHPLFHGELGSEAGSRPCKPEKGSLEPKVAAQFPYLHDQKEMWSNPCVYFENEQMKVSEYPKWSFQRAPQ